jgi:hypothetical protein
VQNTSPVAAQKRNYGGESKKKKSKLPNYFLKKRSYVGGVAIGPQLRCLCKNYMTRQFCFLPNGT